MAETVATHRLATPPTAAVGAGGELAARLQDLRKCVHCGICLPQCPTYLTLGEEMDSPRGRLYLMRAVAEGRIALNGTVARHLDLCLGCRACETACPSGVAYGSLLEATRAALAPRRPVRERLLARALFAVFPHPARIGTMLRALELYRASGLATLVRWTGLLDRFPRLRAMESLVAEVPRSDGLPEVLPASGKRRGRVGLLTGCIQRHLYPHVNRDSARLLGLAGWEVVVPRDQGCCGALELHAGHLDAFRERARSLVASFPVDCDFIAVNAAGCGSAMKEYDHWIDEPRMRGFALKTRDITELLVEAELPLGRVETTVAYHDACHLAHGQRIRREPRELLARIPGLVLVDLPESDLCCGSAGVYNLLEPELAERLLERKVQRIVESGARVIATGNAGCLLQIAKGCRERGVMVEVVHPVELLARAVAHRGG
jgi:glycolate oxidase iron-sulfur subunit